MRFLTPSAIFLLLLSPLAGQVVLDQNIDQFGVGKRQAFVQSGPGSQQVAFTEFTFEAFIDLEQGGALTAATLQGPLLGGTQILSIDSFGSEYSSAQYTGDPTTAKGNLNGHFANSTPGNSGTNYTLNFTTDPQLSYSVSFSLAGDQYVEDTPLLTINNGAWQNATYVVASTGEQTMFGWTFNDYNASTDVVLFSIRPTQGGVELVDVKFQGTNPGGYTVPANLFSAGTDYTVELTFARIVDNPTAQGLDAVGVAFYAVETSLALQAVPEPSTYALLGTGLAAVLIWSWRRRVAAKPRR